MKVRDVLSERMLTDVKVISMRCTLRETADRLVDHQIGILIVVGENGEPVGIVSERDLIRAITQFDSGFVDKPVGDIMTRSVITCGPHDSIYDVLSTMKANKIRHIPIIDAGELANIVSIRDLTQACEMLQVQANTDVLTGLSNRRFFLDALANELDRSRRYGHPLSVALIDIDHFKQVNDTLGHMAGDRALCTLSELLVEELRTHDSVGRLGGEEFGVLFPETDIVGAKIVCDRLLARIGVMDTKFDDATFSFTVSIGLVVVNPEEETVTNVLKRADKLMYAAKADGRNRVVADLSDSQPQPNEREPVINLNAKNAIDSGSHNVL